MNSALVDLTIWLVCATLLE